MVGIEEQSFSYGFRFVDDFSDGFSSVFEDVGVCDSIYWYVCEQI